LRWVKVTTEISPRAGIPKFVRPQKEWKWEIAIYLYLAGMGAGAYVIGVGLGWLGYHLNPSETILFWSIPFDLSKAALLWGPLLVALGAPFLILDLGKKDKFFSACLNPRTSWVARGFLILSVFILLGLANFVRSILAFPWLAERSALWIVLEGISVIFALATAIYTGILLKSVKYVPIWNTPLLPALFLVSALSTGSMGVVLTTMGYGLFFQQGSPLDPLIPQIIGIEQILILIEGIVLALYLFSKSRVKDQGAISVRLLVSGDLKVLFWGGIVAIGFIFPVLLEYLYSHLPAYPVLLIATGLFLLTGGFLLRLAVLASGIKEQLPMHKLIEMKINLSAFQKNVSLRAPFERPWDSKEQDRMTLDAMTNGGDPHAR